MAIPGIGQMVGAAGLNPIDTKSVAKPKNTGAEGDFGNIVVNALQGLEALQDKSDGLAIKAATGDLSDVHDYTIAATEATLATEFTVAVRNRAVEAFNEIMRMQI
ncbi:MAG: flagellar hook-basal body complex protein FliE [Actinomycetota bacterium]|nr:flagellar hook-basal body complex protein FliE [Actinomycetota bacterium]